MDDGNLLVECHPAQGVVNTLLHGFRLVQIDGRLLSLQAVRCQQRQQSHCQFLHVFSVLWFRWCKVTHYPSTHKDHIGKIWIHGHRPKSQARHYQPITFLAYAFKSGTYISPYHIIMRSICRA